MHDKTADFRSSQFDDDDGDFNLGEFLAPLRAHWRI